MITQAQISDAIADLFSATLEGESFSEALVETAKDYGIKVEVLNARFTAQHGEGETLMAREAAKAADADRAAKMDGQRVINERAKELATRKAIAEYFATRSHGLGRGVTRAAQDYLNVIK